LPPGTEVSFTDEVRRAPRFPWSETLIGYKTAIFRQINLHNRTTHHDALEFPNGEVVLLTLLEEGQQATVLQLPASPENSKAKVKANAAVEAELAGAIS
jgi:hypothetical protein